MELHNHYSEFQQAGVEVVALAVASCSSVDSWRRSEGIMFPLLADPDHEVAESLHVYNLWGREMAAPAVFIIDTDRRILWYYIGENMAKRADVQEVLKHLP